MTEDPYLDKIKQNLPRILALFDTDRTSRSHGMGDRYYWAWGLIDFGNGSFQGAAHGMSVLWKNGLWPYKTGSKKFLDRIHSMFLGAKSLTRKDGSLEEAFPREGSYCVTALVAFDLLCATEFLEKEIDQERKSHWLSIIAPMIRYLVRSDETHAFISNHLATAVAALVRWHALTGEENALKKARLLSDRIVKNQSKEGWFKEYEGADPGYQSLCTYYLADVHLKRPDFALLEPLSRSVKFLWYFAHPDGSFGGIYGSRCTRFYYPAGIEMLSREIPEAAALANYMKQSIDKEQVVTLSSMDEPNLVPMFNAYCRAAAVQSESNSRSGPALPCLAHTGRMNFPEAGIIIDGGDHHYSIISTHKGGVTMHFKDRKLALLDAGVVVKNSSGKTGSNQGFEPKNKVQDNNNSLVIHSVVTPMPKQLPGPLDFFILRLFSLTIFRNPTLREWIKKILVKLLITRKTYWPVRNIREIRLGYDLTLSDHLEAPSAYHLVDYPGAFVPIHMASQGYWQIQEEETA